MSSKETDIKIKWPGRVDTKNLIFPPNEKKNINETLAKVQELFPEVSIHARKIFLEGLKNSSLNVSKKNPGEEDTPQTYVTQADKEINLLFKNWIKKNFPTYSFLGEESGLDAKNSLYEFDTDPIDGTKNYAMHIGKPDMPNSSIVTALRFKGIPVFASVDIPGKNQVYTATIDMPTKVNGQKISPSKTNELTLVSNSLKPERQKALEGLLSFTKKNYTLTSTLCEVIDLIRGKADIYIGFNVNQYEWPAAVLLAHQNGNIIWEFGKKQGSFDFNNPGTRNIAIARNEEIFRFSYPKINYQNK